MTPYVGMPVIYVPRPGRRETEIAALVTAVHSDDRCDLNIFPPMAESYQQPKVPMLSDKFTSHVWKVPDAMKATIGPDPRLVAELVPFSAENLAAVIARIEAIEAKRGPGRPPNPAKSEQAA